MDVDVGVGGVSDRGFDESGTRVEEECQRSVNGEIYPSSSDMWDREGGGTARRTKPDCDIGGEFGLNCWWV